MPVSLDSTALALRRREKSTIDQKEQIMKRILIGAATVTALAMTGLSAHAGCADPRTAGQPGANHTISAEILQTLAAESRLYNGSAAERIVGTWHVSYTVEGAPFADAFIQWHSDGTEWEDINLPVLSGNVCMGSWKPIDFAHVYRNHIGWLYTNGTLTGYFTETETDLLSRDGNSYSGTNDQVIYDLTGKKLAEVTGTSTATRIFP
jgi:hypothetical protein